MNISLQQHDVLTKFYEKNPVPDRQQRESIAKSYGMSNVEVESWFSKCQVVGPEELWQEIMLEIIKLQEEWASNEPFTAHKHKTLTKFYKTNPTPDYDQREIIRKSVELTNVEVDLWFFMCRKMGPDAFWLEFGEEAEIEKEKDQKEQLETMLQSNSKKKLEEQVENGKKENEELRKIIAQQAEELKESKNLIADKNAEIQCLIKNSVKDQVNAQQDQAANLTTMANIQQSIPARLLNVEKELARVSLQQKAFEEAELKKENERLKEQKKELEAILQCKKKLEVQVENKTKENEELSLLLKENNNKIVAMTQRNEEQAAELKKFKNLLAGIQNLTSLQHGVQDAVNAQQEQIAKLLNIFKENCSTGLRCWSFEDIQGSSSLHPPIKVPEDSD
ncbi:hypothetical protein CRE_01322 [Caenorhabditis remanei]|uniref:Homeobox domain-containing protein n=1 Tax=Caenorhabditis remanei TaxID=31234 RepID=E3N9P0_CAERE|nr:hypothetical protein CRE_01322 [Caenorhabditis remanei]